jgi:hypothetical protein
MTQSVKILQQGHTAAESERNSSRRDILKLATSLSELRAEKADLFGRGQTMSALTTWGERISASGSERPAIENYELQAAVSHDGFWKGDGPRFSDRMTNYEHWSNGAPGHMTLVPEAVYDVDTEDFIIKEICHAPRADCMKSGHEVASLDEEMMEIEYTEEEHGSNRMTVATVAIAIGDQDEATEDEDSISGEEFASLGKEMSEGPLDGADACSSFPCYPSFV